MKKGRWLVVVGFLAAAAAGPAAAQLYAGGSLGYSQFKDICQIANVPCDDKDTAWRAFGGYQFNQYFALELGFGDLGAATGSGAIGSFAVEAKEAWDLSAVFSLPVSTRLSALLRLGAHRTRATVDQQGPTFAPVHEAKTGSAFIYGAGAEYSLGKLGVRAEWQHYDNVAGGTQAETDIDVFNVSLLFRF
ncbi:MAG TPA: outer membrane beta-barrel protein [Burkholderiales bacterium]|nr:outer membrane beta-barrel protein [Burkholderiales bacterium]